MENTTAQDIQKELCERFYIESTHFSHESECSHICPLFSEERNGNKDACARTLDNFCKVKELYELYKKQAEPYESCELFKNFNIPIQNTMGNDNRCIHPKNACAFRNDKGECIDVSIRAQFCKHNTEKTTQNTEERVNHPEHYQHPSGVECITVARHHDFNIGNALKYIWRAGLKQEQGISPTDKQIEDLQKAVFYIQDEIQFLKEKKQEQ